MKVILLYYNVVEGRYYCWLLSVGEKKEKVFIWVKIFSVFL